MFGATKFVVISYNGTRKLIQALNVMNFHMVNPGTLLFKDKETKTKGYHIESNRVGTGHGGSPAPLA